MEDFTALSKNTENDDDFAITNYFIENLSPNKALATNASSMPISINNTGTGNNVLSTSPSLITPFLGSATATTLSASSFIISQANINGPNGGLFSRNTSGSSGAFSYIGVGPGSGDLVIFRNSSSRLIEGGVNAATIRNDGGSLNLSNSGETAKITLSGSTITMNTTTSITNLNVSGATTSGSLELTGNAAIAGLSSSRVVFTNGTKTLVSKVGFSYASYFSSAVTPAPNNTWTTIVSLTSNGTGGTGLLSPQSSTASFANSFTVPLLFVITFTSRPVGTGIANWAARILINNDEPLSQYEGASGRNEVCISCTGVLQPLDLLKCQVNQYTGFGQNAEGIRICITTYPI